MIEYDEVCADCGAIMAPDDLASPHDLDCPTRRAVLDGDWSDSTSPRADERAAAGPDPEAVAELTEVLDLMVNFPSNEQRARFLLSSNWMEKWGESSARRIRESLAATRGVGR